MHLCSATGGISNRGVGALSLSVSIVGFVVAAAVIGLCGVLMTIRAEHLARVTGLGQAIMGAVFIGASTSLSGIVTSGRAAAAGHASLAASNGLGGIAAQTVFLALADIVYRRANLEHAAASEANLQQNALLIVMLAIPLIAFAVPTLTLGWIHPASLILPVAYGFGVRLVYRAHEEPMWHPRLTRETERESRDRPVKSKATVVDWLVFLGLAAVVAMAGWAIAEFGISISSRTHLDESVVGGIFTSISTSLPELVIAITAVRRGALTLAVGDILGGNSFDVLFLAVSDVLFTEGSLYEALGPDELIWNGVSILLAGVILMGLLRRERHGIGNIGFESALVLMIYATVVAALILS
jgi:cation:H+ antiporter